MNHSRTNGVLFLCALALGAFILFFERRGDAPTESKDGVDVLLSFNPDRVSSVHVVTPGYSVEAVREGDRWRMVRPLHAPADAEGILRLLFGIQALPRHTVIRPEDLWTQALTPRDYGLDRPRATLALTGPGIDVRVEVGEPAALGRLYLRLPDIDTILGVDTNVLALVPPTAAAFRDRTLFPAAASDVRQIRIRRPAGYLHLVRGEGGAWRLLQPVRARLDRMATARLIDTLLSARIVDFVQDAVSLGSPYGLDETAAELTVDFERIGAQSVSIQIGRPVESDAKRIYARRMGGESVFTVSQEFAQILSTPLDKLRDSRLTAVPADEIGAVSIERESGRLRMIRTGDAWRIVEPIMADADVSRVTSFLQAWAGVRVEEYPVVLPSDIPTPPAGAVRVAFYRPAGEGRPALDFSAAETNAPPPLVRLWIEDSDGDLMRAVVEDADGTTPVRVRKIDGALLSIDPLRFRDRTVLNLDPSEIEGMILARGGTEQRVMRDASGGWTAADGATARLDAMPRRLQTLASLRAADLVAQTPVDLVSYGLDPPAVSLTIVLRGEGSPVRSLLFGRSTDDGVYAAFRGQALVFRLSPEDAVALQSDLIMRADPAGAAP